MSRNSAKSIAVVWIYTVSLVLLLGLTAYLSMFFDSVNRQATIIVCADNERDLDELRAVMLRAGATQVDIESMPVARCPGGARQVTYTEQSNLARRSRVEANIAPFLNGHELEYYTASVTFEGRDRLELTLAPALLSLAVAGLFLVRQRTRARYVQRPEIDSRDPWLVVVGLVTAILLYAFAVLIFSVFELTSGRIARGSIQTASFSIGAIVVLSVLLPIFEEIVFRAWLLEAWRKLMHPQLALWLSALAFSAAHPMGLLENAVYLLFGLAYGLVWLRTRSLLACCVAHGTYNFLVLLTAMNAG